jgi:uncharacterized membrane protein YgcG
MLITLATLAVLSGFALVFWALYTANKRRNKSVAEYATRKNRRVEKVAPVPRAGMNIHTSNTGPRGGYTRPVQHHVTHNYYPTRDDTSASLDTFAAGLILGEALSSSSEPSTSTNDSFSGGGGDFGGGGASGSWGDSSSPGGCDSGGDSGGCCGGD